MNENNRRGFLRLLGITGFASGLLASGQESHGDAPKREFRGLSKKGDMEEALHNAISAAQGSVRHPDAMVDWTLKRISGRSGGFVGFREVTVTIEAKVS